MALDAALLESVRAGAPPVLRLYLWKPACLSLGRNQPARDLYDPRLAALDGIDVVRRPTGGLAVLHDAELTYAVIAPMSLVGRPRDAYRRINGWLVDALGRVGVSTSSAVGVPSPRWTGGGAGHPCFASPAPGELVAAGRKLVGSAQRAEGGCILQHGSILLDDGQTRIRRLERGFTGDEAPVGATSIRELTGAPLEPRRLAGAVADAVAAGGTPLAPARLGREERQRCDALRSLFASAAWTWRR